LPRYKLTISYDGTDFHGWQFQHQPDPASDPALGEARPRISLRTVQEEVQRAVREIVREPVIVMGSSRTDSGVHARGQVAAFSCSPLTSPDVREPVAADAVIDSFATAPTMPLPAALLAPDGGKRADGGWPVSRGIDRLMRAINGRLPPDIVVLDAAEASHRFNPIGDTECKCYSYTIHASRERTLFDRNYVHHVWEPLDVASMQEAAQALVGEHDFAGFAALGHGRLTTVRTIHSCSVIEVDPQVGMGLESRAPSVMEAAMKQGVGITGARVASPASRPGEPPSIGFPMKRVVIEVTGSGFLWNMVRIIAGTLAEVGRGRKKPGDMHAILESRDRRQAGPTFPAQGLCLEWIKYRPDAGEADSA